MSSLNLRLVAYDRDGAFLGLLPMPTEYSVGLILNEISSLTISYSDLATKSEMFSTPIEVAVQYADITETKWVEPDNGRFLLLEKAIDKADQTRMANYTLPGYAWLLNKTIVNMSAPDRARNSGKRSFQEMTPGAMMLGLVNESKSRGSIPGMSVSFTATTDSDGVAWRHQAVGLSFDAGTPLISVLKSLSDAGLAEWCMRGRTLCIFNPDGELAAPRAQARALKTTNSVSLRTFLDSVANSLSSVAQEGLRTGTPDAQRSSANIVAVAQHGEAPFNPQGYQLAIGKDTTLTAIAGGFPLSLWAKGPSPDGAERALGAFVMNLNRPTNWFFACPRMDSTSRPDLLAMDAFSKWGNGAILLNECTPDLEMERNPNSGYSLAGRKLIQKGVTCVEIMTFPQSEFPSANVLIEAGLGKVDNHLRLTFHNQMVAQGFDVRSNLGAVLAADTRPGLVAKEQATYHVLLVAQNAANHQKGGATAAQRNAITKATIEYNTARNARVAFDAMSTTNMTRSIPTAELPKCLKNGSWLQNEAHTRKTRYIRVAVAENYAQNLTWRSRFGTALTAAMSLVQTPQKIPFTYPKGYISDAEIVDPVVLSAVDLRMGRDIVEAPTQSTLTDMATRVYAYGDSWTQTVIENTEAPKFWGTWEIALASGGVNDTETLELNAQAAIDKGGAERVSMTRGVTFERARWLPFKHYDAGDIVSAPDPDGVMIPMRIHQLTINKTEGSLTGSLVMADRFLPVELKRSNAIVAASGGAIGGTTTGGGGVRPVAPVTDVRKLLAPVANPT